MREKNNQNVINACAVELLTRRSLLGSVEKVRVVAHLPELHQDVQQSYSIWTTQLVELEGILSEHFYIPLLLHFCQTDVQFGFFLRRKRCRNVLFDSTKHKWAKHRVQLLYDIFLSRFVAETEPSIKLLSISKDLWNEEVSVRGEEGMMTGDKNMTGIERCRTMFHLQQGPQLSKIVLINRECKVQRVKHRPQFSARSNVPAMECR
jgi:hypothetical protein